MPISKGKSQKTISKNISKLVTEKPGKTRAKAIDTIAKKEGISKEKAKQKQAVAIALSTAKVKPKSESKSENKMDKKMGVKEKKVESKEYSKKPTYSLDKSGMKGFEIKKNGKPIGEYTVDKASSKVWLANKNKKK